MKKIILVFIILLLSISSNAQLFNTYDPVYVPERTTPIRVPDFKIGHLDEIERNARIRSAANAIVASEVVTSQSLCIETNKIYDIQVKVSQLRSGKVLFQVLGIKLTNNWTPCSIELMSLEELYNQCSSNDTETRSMILNYLEYASYCFIYNDKLYLAGGK